MLTRAMTSTAAGLGATLVLIYAMHLLIEMGESIEIVKRIPHRLAPFLAPEEPDTPVREQLPERFPKPVDPPERLPQTFETAAGDGIGIPVGPVPRPVERITFEGVAMSDGPLINIIKVQPHYPITAITRGLEGTVLVQFDVTATGAVTNVVVLESTSRIFEKAAIEAAYRFKYKPRVVDGIPHGATGLKQLFTFEMEK